MRKPHRDILLIVLFVLAMVAGITAAAFFFSGWWGLLIPLGVGAVIIMSLMWYMK